MTTAAAITPTASAVLSPTACMTARPSEVLVEVNRVRDLGLLGRFNRMVAQGITPMGAAGVLACHEGVIVQTIQCRLEKARESYKEAP